MPVLDAEAVSDEASCAKISKSVAQALAIPFDRGRQWHFHTNCAITWASSSVSLGVKAALAGSVLSNLPSKMSENAVAIPDIIKGLSQVEFGWTYIRRQRICRICAATRCLIGAQTCFKPLDDALATFC